MRDGVLTDSSMSHETKLERQRLHKRIQIRVLAVVGAVFFLMIMLSLSEIQKRLFPTWLIANWGRVIAAVVVLAITAILLLPIVIEANLNSRRLSGPGRLPPPYRPPWDDPTLPKP